MESEQLREQASTLRERSSVVTQRVSEQRERATVLRKAFPRHGDDLEIWNARIQSASYEELLAFRDCDYLGLGSVVSEKWTFVIRAVEDEIQRRGLTT